MELVGLLGVGVVLGIPLVVILAFLHYLTVERPQQKLRETPPRGWDNELPY